MKNNMGCFTLDEKMGQTYIHYEMANTLAERDYKQPQAVIMQREPIVFRDDITIKIDGGGKSFTVSERDYKGVQCVVQNITGTISPGAHPGSYNGQDAYNDLLVVDDGVCDAGDRPIQEVGHGKCDERTGSQRCNRSDFEGGV